MGAKMRPETRRIQKEAFEEGVRLGLEYIDSCIARKIKFTQGLTESMLGWAYNRPVIYTDEIRRLKQQENYRWSVVGGRSKVAKTLAQVYRTMQPSPGTVVNAEIKKKVESLL